MSEEVIREDQLDTVQACRVRPGRMAEDARGECRGEVN